LGDKGENVRQLQISLNKFHYMLTADGVFGKLTELSVKNFQGKTGLIADGIAGPATLAALASTPAAAPYLYVYNSGTDANNPSSKATVLFTFDDGYKDVITVAADILKEKNFKGTAYIYETGIIGGYSSSMNLSDLNKLYADYGWDIGNHTAHHSIKGDISDPAYLHAVEKDYLDNQNWLLLNGWTRSAYHAAYVGGVYNIDLIDYLKGIGVKTGRAAWSGGMPANDLYQIQCIDVSLNSLTACETEVDKAVSSKSTLVFSIHKINTAGGSYVIKTPDFQSLVDYVSKYALEDKLVVTTISEYYNSLK
jgi:peptidoglycan/xylan/chitin deacetylase (PgdA/CDA1 family)